MYLICTQNPSKGKVYTLLNDGTISCAHLQCMNRNYDHWEHMIKRSDNADSGESGVSYYFTEHGEQLRAYQSMLKINIIMKLTL